MRSERRGHGDRCAHGRKRSSPGENRTATAPQEQERAGHPSRLGPAADRRRRLSTASRGQAALLLLEEVLDVVSDVVFAEVEVSVEDVLLAESPADEPEVPEEPSVPPEDPLALEEASLRLSVR